MSSDSTLLEANFLANADVIDESSPPDNKTPYGTSLINCLLTAADNESWIAFIDVSEFFTLLWEIQSGLYHFINSELSLKR